MRNKRFILEGRVLNAFGELKWDQMGDTIVKPWHAISEKGKEFGSRF